ncbi:GH92 family glycosyl hydrolase [Amycolatopsis sp. GM8]|uniref:GH92 family glycosyl hydrolase n=1 Tax=Amycolatopsis sp. GM8 TaxID=2896530 RepID=UPI001EFFAC1A|nr:GH92 family glycosyl hydrolase [Amycolatopsis sp. GM8]
MVRTRVVSVLVSAVALVAGFAPAATAAPPALSFSSSFEPGDPQPAVDTVEKSSGVNGANGSAVPGDIRGKVTDVTASDENTDGGEIAVNLLDASPDTKWLAWEPTGWVRFQLSEPVAITHYALTSANDAPERDPKDWTLEGSADGQVWTTIDQQTGQSFGKRFQTTTYQLPSAVTYQYYRLNVTANAGGPILQLAELLLANDEPAPPPLPYMRSYPDSGPVGGYSSKPHAGFTGLHAFRYSGTQTSDGHGYSYNRMFDVRIPVRPDTELSYEIFPQFTGSDLRYPSTNVALDLMFTDGSRLSDLGATDQYGFTLSPQGQGAGKALYTNQWNLIRAQLGKVARGKTISRILVGYDSTAGQASFGGWVDDVRLAPNTQQPAAHLSDNVLTTRGSNANGNFSRGNNFPATAVPHGFNFWTPETDAGSDSWLYRYQESNNAQNLPTLEAFGLSHEPSPWMGDRQTFQIMPSTAAGVPDGNRTARALPFKHDNETARPYYYGVRFENGMTGEIAPTDHAAMLRFTFPDGNANLIFDNVRNEGGLTLDPATNSLSGYSDVKSGLSAGAGRLYVYASFDQPVSTGGMLPGDGRDNVRGYLKFGGTTVTMRIATSLISVDQAKKNLGLEIAPRASFESVRDAAQAAWDKQLGVIEVRGASQDQLTTLYSNLYRLFLYPNSGFENVGTARQPKYAYASPFTQQVVDGKLYVNNGFWDTYRTTWPAYDLLSPDMAGTMIDGFVQQYRDGGWIARWSSPGYANLMTGTSSDVAFADAYLKGIRNFDIQSAYDAAIKNATVTPPNDSVGRKGLDSSIFLGYTPATTGEGMSWGIEGYVNDFGIANLSKKLADEAKPGDPRKQEYLDNYTYFLNRAQNYVHMFDPSVGFFQGRNPDGSFRTPAGQYDPRSWGGDYTETDGWGMAFTVPQDGQGLADLYGGKQGLANKLDQFFATQETATFPGAYGGTIHEMREARDVRMGQYGHSNQPSHHILYMYDYAGQPSKTQAKVREALSRLYVGSEIGQGYPGDDDNGEMSAWYIFSALGFYPLQMGSPDYAVGSPLFQQATIHLPGRDLVINAPKNSAKNVYVQGLRVNGRPWTSTSLPHDLLARGGTLDFDMGPNPSRWGTGPFDAPDSITKGDQAPVPLADVTGPGKGTGSPAALFDNTSKTEAQASTVQYQLSAPGDPVSSYTLTSGAGPGGDPAAWTLSGSTDGQHWSTLDSRQNQTFTWRDQTRPFHVAHPGAYTYYRLQFTGPVTLSEVELLGKPR